MYCVTYYFYVLYNVNFCSFFLFQLVIFSDRTLQLLCELRGSLTSVIGERGVAVNCEKTQFFLNTLYFICLIKSSENSHATHHYQCIIHQLQKIHLGTTTTSTTRQPTVESRPRPAMPSTTRSSLVRVPVLSKHKISTLPAKGILKNTYSVLKSHC